MKKLLLLLAFLIPSLVWADITTGLIARWKLDEASGTLVADSSGNGHDGTSTASPSWVAGQIDGALQFTGDDNVSVPTSAAFGGLTEFTVSMLINPATLSVYNHVFGVWGGAGQRSFSIDLTPFTAVEVATSSNGTNYHTQSTTLVGLTLNTWQHVAVTYKAGVGYEVYLNNVSQTVGADYSNESLPSAIASLSVPLNFAEDNDLADGVARFVGKLDEVRFYNRKLSSGDITELYEFEGDAAATTGAKITILGVGQ